MKTRKRWLQWVKYHCGVVINDFNLKSDAVRAREITIKYLKRDLTITWIWFIS